MPIRTDSIDHSLDSAIDQFGNQYQHRHQHQQDSLSASDIQIKCNRHHHYGQYQLLAECSFMTDGSNESFIGVNSCEANALKAGIFLHNINVIEPKKTIARHCLKPGICTALYCVVKTLVPNRALIREYFHAHLIRSVILGNLISAKTGRRVAARSERCLRRYPRARWLLRLPIVLGICLAAYSTAHAQQVPIVAAASSLRVLWPDLMTAYTNDTGERQPKVSFGSSGLLSTQIINGAPFELFLSADQQSIERIPKQQLAVSPQVFARGTLQLAVLADSAFANELSISTLINALNKARKIDTRDTAEFARFRIAIPNPVHAPYGQAAQQALEQAQQWPLPEGALVVAENASQTVQFLRTGAVSAALVPKALLYNNKADLVSVALPAHSYQRVEHVLAILKTDNHSATTLARWLLGNEAQQVLVNSGLQAGLP